MMDKHFYNNEIIEAYVEGSLSPADKAIFENEIAKDPLLQNEVQLQNDIVETIKQHRKAELKNRLNNIDVNTAPSYLGVKIAASVLLTGLMGYGVYSYINHTDAPSDFNNQKETVQVLQQLEKPIPAVDNIKNNNSNTTEVSVSPINENSHSPINNGSNSHIPNGANEVNNTPDLLSVDAPDMHNNEMDPDVKEENIKLPDSKIAQAADTKSNIDVTVDPSTNNKFHYKFSDNKLFLYGNFESKTYEILELNSYKGKQVYLHYDNNYYNLNSNQLSPIQLEKITNKKTIEELTKFSK